MILHGFFQGFIKQYIEWDCALARKSEHIFFQYISQSILMPPSVMVQCTTDSKIQAHASLYVTFNIHGIQGNGLCAPCANPTKQFLCCYYSDDGCQNITVSSCSKDSTCPILSGMEICEQTITSHCIKCYPDDGKIETRIN